MLNSKNHQMFVEMEPGKVDAKSQLEATLSLHLKAAATRLYEQIDTRQSVKAKSEADAREAA